MIEHFLSALGLRGAFGAGIDARIIARAVAFTRRTNVMIQLGTHHSATHWVWLSERCAGRAYGKRKFEELCHSCRMGRVDTHLDGRSERQAQFIPVEL